MRDSTFDIMKGIAIISMIIGHSTIPDVVWRFIFVWHMPLFFFVSGYFYKPKPELEYVKRNIKQLLLPYFVTSLLLILLTYVKELLIGKGSAMVMLIAAIIGNGTPNNPTFSEYSIGAIWFLIAMFWCRSIYNILYIRIDDKFLFGVSILTISVVASYIGSTLYVPTDILEGMGALLIFYIGHMTRIYGFLEVKWNSCCILVAIVLTGLSMCSGSMSMVRCFYGYWPVNILAAISMIVLIHHISRHLYNCSFLEWCGRVSLVILCVHIIELTFLPLKTLYAAINYPVFLDVFFHLFTSVLITYFILKISYVRCLFSIK